MIKIEVPNELIPNPLQNKEPSRISESVNRNIDRNRKVGRRRKMFYEDLIQRCEQAVIGAGLDDLIQEFEQVKAFDPKVAQNKQADHWEALYYTEKCRRLQEWALDASDKLDDRNLYYYHEFSRVLFKAAYEEFTYKYQGSRSKYRGVTPWKRKDRPSKYYKARINLPGGKEKMDYAHTEIEAALQYDRWVDEYFGGDLERKNFISREEYEQIKKGSGQ